MAAESRTPVRLPGGATERPCLPAADRPSGEAEMARGQHPGPNASARWEFQQWNFHRWNFHAWNRSKWERAASQVFRGEEEHRSRLGLAAHLLVHLAPASEEGGVGLADATQLPGDGVGASA